MAHGARFGEMLMAKLPASMIELVERFGPHRHDVPAGGWAPVEAVDRVVKTHCCFCGQQCGIQLKVKDHRVVGFEPWEEFPFNRGKLCPEGCEAVHARRASRSPALTARSGPWPRFQAIKWDAPLDQVPAPMKPNQPPHGRDPYPGLSGASLPNKRLT